MATLLLGTTIGGYAAIHAGNIASQSVNYANSAGSVAWTNVSGRPTLLSQFTNDLGNYGGWITSSALANYVTTSQVTSSMISGLNNMLGVTTLPYSCDIVVNGDPDRFYAVQFWGGDQDVWRRIIIKRGYGEQAPWDPIGTGVHHGGLLLDWEGNFGGWGGAEYADRIRVFNESYTNVCADMYIYSHSMGYVFMLRGGGAVYHLFSDQPINGFYQSGSPDIAYSTSTLLYDDQWTGTNQYDVPAPTPLTLAQVNSSRIDGLRLKKQSLLDGRYLRQGVDIGSISNISASNNISSLNFLASNAYYLNGTAYYLNSTNGGIYTNARFESASTIYASGGNSSNWNTAYGWGNHASASYIVRGSTQSPGAWPDATKFKSSGDIGTNTSGNHSLQIFADDGNDAFMAFHISSDFATFFGLENSTNRLYTGGWSDGNAKYQIWDSRDFSSSNISNWNTAYGWGNHSGLYASSSHTHDDRYYTESESDSRFVNASGDSMSGSLTIGAGAAYVGTHGDWTGEQNKIQWHSSHLYLQNTGGGNFFFRRADGTNLFNLDNGGSLFIVGNFYPSNQSSYYLYQANSGLWTNGNFGASGDLYLGTRGTWLSSWLNQSVQTGASPTFNELYADGKYSRFGSSSNWDSGSLNGQNSTITNVHFQGHQDFWIGAGNTQWYTSAVGGHHDLLINTMQSGGGNVRGITFTASSGGASVYRLGRWHSGTSAITSYLNLENRLAVGLANYAYSLPSATMYVKGSTDGGDVLAVDGVNGRLFTVTDSVLDTIYSVNTIAGLPILEILANNTVKIGKYGANSITISNSRIAINSDTVDTNFPFYVSDRSTSASRYTLANPGMGFNLADNYAQLQLYGPSGAYIDFVTGANDYNGRIIWASGAFSVTGNMSWGGATLSGAVWNGTAISDSYISSASTWNTAYNKRPTAISFSGSSTKTLTLTQGDGSTLTASFTDTDTNTDAQTLSLSGNTLSISGGNSVTLSSSGMSEATANGRYLYYRGVNAESDFQRFQDSVGEVRFDQINNYNNLSNPPGGYNYGGVLSMRGDNFGFQLWGSHTGDFFFKTQWSDDQYIGWRRVMDTTNYGYAANMNQNVTTSSSPTFTDIYANEWFRNNNNLEGLYNQANGTHFYSRGGAKWAITGSGGNIHLEFRSNHESTLRGVVYADTSNQIGFLNNGEGWTFRTNSSNHAFVHGTDLTINADGAGYSNIHMNDGDEGSRTIHCNSDRIGFLNQSSSWGAWLDDGNNWYAAGSVRAPIFYDSENTAHYLDPSGGSNIRNLYIGDSGSSWSDPGGWGTQVIFSNGPHTKLVLQARTPGIEAGMYVHTPGSVYIGSYTSHDVNLMRAGSRRMLIADGYIYSDVYMEAAGSMRAPIFYDSNNTSYYADFGSSGTSISMNGGITTTAPGGSVLLKHAVSEVDAWIFQENAANWGIYWKNNPSGNHTFGGYTTIGAETFGMSAANASGNGVYTSNFVGASTAYAQWMLSNYTGYIWSASTIFAAGDMRAPIFYDSNNTGYYVDPDGSSRMATINADYIRSYGNARVDNNLYLDQQYGSSIIGVYSSYRYQGVFAMGDSYKLAIDGSGVGNLYGMAWSHPNAGGVAGNLNTHGLLVMENGTFLAAVSGSIRARDDMRAPALYDSGSRVAISRGEGRNYVDYSRYVYNNGAYSGTGWTEPSDLGVRYANSAGSAPANGGTATALNSSNYISQRGSNGSWNADFQATSAGTMSYGGDLGANGTNGPGGSWWIQQNFRHTNSSNYWGTQVAWGWEDNANRLATRNVTGGNYGGWVYYLNSSNYTSYIDAPNKAGTSYYQVNTWLQMNGTHGVYWPSYNGAHFYVNTTSSYTQFRLDGNRGGYGGIWDSYSAVHGIMYDGSGNGGVYREANGRWYWYHHVGNNCTGISTSTTSSSYRAYIGGSLYAEGDIVAYSDARKKSEIVTIDSALEKVKQLRGVYYVRTDEAEKGRQTGVIAQEINEVLPEVVTYAADIDEYGVKYGNIVGVLIEAIKEQQTQIEDLKLEIKKLRGE